MQDNINTIKDKIDIVELISEYIKLTKAGINFKACCPFHNEKTPSFYVSPERQIWHCFGCNKGGSIFDFIMEVEGLEFVEALNTLAHRAGIELRHFDAKITNQRTKLIEICRRANKFFEKQLWESNTGQASLAYLKGRGLTDDSIKFFNLGFAPDSWDSLFIFLKNSGYAADEIIGAGLALKKESGGYYDRFRSRIMFPILDIHGQVVGFTGRIFESSEKKQEGAAKYINTPQTIIYDKSSILYGLDKAKMAIKKSGKCLVVEGNMDVVMSHQAGVQNCVASSGTALTDRQLNIIKRYTKKVNFCFDSDAAGLMATERGVGLALSNGFDVGVISIDDSECKDPADYVQKYGAKWVDASAKSQPVVGFYINQTANFHDPKTVEGKKTILSKVLPMLKSLSNAVERSHWLTELAAVINAREEDIRLEMEKAIPVTALAHVSAEPPEKYLSKPVESVNNLIVENYIMSLILKNPVWLKENNSKINKSLFSDAAQEFMNQLEKYEGNFKIEKVLNILPEESRQKAELWHLQSQADWMEIEDSEYENELLKMIGRLKDLHLYSKRLDLQGQIKMAEQSGDREKLTGLIKQFNELHIKI